MIKVAKPIYVPSLRLKEGETLGSSNTSSEINKLVIPRFVVPPKKDRDQSIQASMFPGQKAPVASIDLGARWAGRTILLDCRHLHSEFEDAKGFDWLTALFMSARQSSINAVPVATVEDLMGATSSAYKQATGIDSSLKLALCVDYSVLDGDIQAPIEEALGRMGLHYSDCSVIADFSDADFSEIDSVADVLQGSLELLQEIGLWHHIVFSGSNFPNKNPAQPSNSTLVSRNEWLAWKQAVKFNSDTAEQLVFGDYAPDCSKMQFDGSGGRPIRHLRYTCDDAWFIARGAGTGKQEDDMREVCRAIVNSEHYSGRAFSGADEWIYQLASNLPKVSAGRPTDWRAINIERHLTKVVRDIGAIRGLRFKENEFQPAIEQITQFDLLD